MTDTTRMILARTQSRSAARLYECAPRIERVNALLKNYIREHLGPSATLASDDRRIGGVERRCRRISALRAAKRGCRQDRGRDHRRHGVTRAAIHRAQVFPHRGSSVGSTPQSECCDDLRQARIMTAGKLPYGIRECCHALIHWQSAWNRSVPVQVDTRGVFRGRATSTTSRGCPSHRRASEQRPMTRPSSARRRTSLR